MFLCVDKTKKFVEIEFIDAFCLNDAIHRVGFIHISRMYFNMKDKRRSWLHVEHFNYLNLAKSDDLVIRIFSFFSYVWTVKLKLSHETNERFVCDEKQAYEQWKNMETTM